MDLANYVQRQKEWSKRTFGEGKRTKGLIKHIMKELKEIEEDPNDPIEWVDVIILALDGLWRLEFTPEEVCKLLEQKQEINFKREWPRPKSEDEPSYHVEEE